MDPVSIDAVVERLRAGRSVALGGSLDAPLIEPIDRALRALGRTVVWIDLEGAQSGAELGARIVEACVRYLDPDELGDVLEGLPARGRIDLEAFAALLMLPERIAAATGHRVVAILTGFHAVERTIGFAGLGAVREALLLRDRVSYLFVGSRRLQQLFERPNMPLYGLAEVVAVGPGRDRSGPSSKAARAGRTRPSDQHPAATDGSAPGPDDPLASALLAWADPPPPAEPAPERILTAEAAWERLLARELAERAWLDRLDGDDDEHGRRWRRRRGRR